MKWAPYVCVCVRPCVRVSGLKMLKFASSLSFLGRFWFCLFYLIGLVVPAERSSLEDYETGSVRVCVCVRASVRVSGLEICFFSVISWPILILFVLSDRAWWGLQNFYTEVWNSLIMQIYANLFKTQWKMPPLLYSRKLTPFHRSALPAGTYITHRVIYLSTCLKLNQAF